jgi:hypothetical protein
MCVKIRNVNRHLPAEGDVGSGGGHVELDVGDGVARDRLLALALGEEIGDRMNDVHF